MMLSLIIDNANNLVWANTKAQALLGIPAQGDTRTVASVFGPVPLYQRIEQEAFNYRWTGRLKVRLASGKQGVFYGHASWVTDNLWVFNQIFFEGSLSNPDLTKIDRSFAENFAVQPAQLRKVYEISASINSNLDFQSICVDVTMKAAELVGAERSLLYNVTDKEIGVFATWNMSNDQRDLFKMVDYQHGIIKNCLKHRSPVLVPAYSIHPDWIPEIYEALCCFESFILYPLYAGQRLVGVLALFKHEPLQFGERHLMLLQMISNQMAIAVLNAQTYSNMRNITNNLERELGLKASQLRVSELALIRKSNELAAVFDAITDALFVVDGNFVIYEVNQAGLCFSGVVSNVGLIGRSYCDVVGRRYNCGNCYLSQTLDSGLPQTAEIEVNDKLFNVTTYPVLDEEGQTNQVVCALRDVTVVRKKGAELIQSQKMQAVGLLAAGVAHEIRNPLGAISNYVYLLEEQMLPNSTAGMADPAEIRETLGGIRRLVERSETVIRNLLDFSRDKAPTISTFPLRGVIDQILLLVGKTAQKRKVEITVDGDKSAQVTSDTGAMQHILFNLVINAIGAIENGGTVQVRYSVDKDGFIIVIEDNGGGIAREHMDKIFNPFFTTKAPDRGTGLGLYLVYNEVRRLGGTIAVESAPGGPTKFTVHFVTGDKGVS